MTSAVFLIVVICVSGDTIINHLMYADDLVLISPSATGMKELLCACEVYSLEHAIIYNSKKGTVVVCRNKAMMNAVRISFIVNGDVIQESEKVKYLGHIICSDLSDDEDMMRQRRHLYAQGNVISRSFHMCSIAVKNTLFRTFCTPMYTCHLWWNYTAQSFHKLKIAFNNAFRMMHNFNFNLIQRALVLEDYAPALGVAGFVSRKKGARSKGKEEKEGGK